MAGFQFLVLFGSLVLCLDDDISPCEDDADPSVGCAGFCRLGMMATHRDMLPHLNTSHPNNNRFINRIKHQLE